MTWFQSLAAMFATIVVATVSFAVFLLLTHDYMAPSSSGVPNPCERACWPYELRWVENASGRCHCDTTKIVLDPKDGGTP